MSLNVNATPFVPQEVNENPQVIELHPCVNCGKTCKGKQCRECHLKMFNSNCIDCDKSFNALRKNGTMRKRCNKCQNEYNQKYIKKCPDCNEEFHDLSEKYKTCLKCYKNFQENKKLETEKKRVTKEKQTNEREKKQCYNRNCKNMTVYKFCKTCNDNKSYLENTYITYKCQECGLRGMGNYSLCIDCTNKK